MARSIDEDELIECWTLVGEELRLLTGRTGPSKLALWLKFHQRYGRFPRGRSELHDEAVAYLAIQVKVPASDLGLFDWEGTTAGRHRRTIREFTGFRECTVPGAEKLTVWLAEQVCQSERRADRVRAELLAHCREEKIEPPTKIQVARIVGSALRQAEETLTLRFSSLVPVETEQRMLTLIAGACCC